MAKHRFLSVLAVPAAVSALLGGVPAAAGAAATAAPGAVGTTGGTAFEPLSPALAARLSRDADKPVIIIMKSQLSEAPAGTRAAAVRAAAVGASQRPLLSELSQVHATGIKRYTLVNAVAATVSAGEEQRLAASPAVAEVVPDATVTVPAPALIPPGTAGSAGPVGPARRTSRRAHVIPGACAPKGKSYLAPEGLALTGTASQSARQHTARRLGITGAGVKVAFLADGVDTRNVNFITRSGRSVFVDYKDFTGDGPKAPTTGGEAFLDANTIAGQGRHVYNVNGFARQSYPGSCDVRIEGVAPGASLVGLDIFTGDPNHPYVTTDSMIAEAINYAVTRDHVNVLNESFGANPFPDTARDVVKLFNDAAVKAGVVVSVSSGDSGPASTIGSPASDPNVISVGASTQFRLYAQSNYGLARYFATRGWLDDNISALSSGGFTQAGQTVNLVAPGDLSWASCDAKPARYYDCVSFRGRPSPIEVAGGTSEAAPFVSGAAALVIQAYRKTHGHHSPSPALVKRILLSTATDLGSPANEQGAGLLNSYRAVQLAESVRRSHKTGSTLFTTTSQLSYRTTPGSRRRWRVRFSNTGSRTQQVRVYGRTLGPDRRVQSGRVRLSDARSNQVVTVDGGRDNYAIFHFKVPAHESRLDVSIAFPADLMAMAVPHLTLVDPKGRLAAYSLPQGPADHGNVDVRTPVAGTWTGVIAGLRARDGGYNGTVLWRAAVQRFTSFGTVSPRTFTIAPGRSRAVTYSVRAPSAPGDLAASLVVRSSRGGRTSIPVTVRTQIDVAAGGAFRGVLTGGNGRGGVGQDNFYSFQVPRGTKAITATLLLHRNPGIGVAVGAYLVSPDGNAVGYGQNYGQSGSTTRTLTASALDPDRGTWTLIVDFATPVPGNEISDAFYGHVRFTAAGTESAALPDSAATTLPAGTPDTIGVKITNRSSAPQAYFLDPRLATLTTMPLAPLSPALTAGSNTEKLPMSYNRVPSLYFVPTHTRSITDRQRSTVPAMVDLGSAIGDPSVASAGLKTGALCHFRALAGYTAAGGAVTSGLWLPEPTECGPFSRLARKGKVTEQITVRTRAFDRAVSVPTGDLMQVARAALTQSQLQAFGKNLVQLQPGKSATVNVTITPSGAAGTVVSGTLYLDALEIGVPPYGQLASSEVAAVRYEYTVGQPAG